MPEPAKTLGVADFARMIFQERDLGQVWDGLITLATAGAPDAGAMFDLSTLLQLTGQREQGLALRTP